MARRRRPAFTPLSVRAARVLFPAAAVIVPLACSERLYSHTVLPKMLAVQFLALAIAAVWAFDVSAGRIRILRSPLFLPAAGFLLWSAAACLSATNRVAAIVSIADQMTFVAVFFLVACTLREGAIPGIARATASVGLIVAAIGFLESFGYDGAWLPVSDGRPSATFGYRNFAASWLVAAIPLSILLTLQPTRRRDRLLGLASTGAMVLFLVYTRSRGAWLGLTAGVVLAGGAVLWWGFRSGVPLRMPRPRLAHIAIALGGTAVFLLLAIRNPTVGGAESRGIDEKKADLGAALVTSFSAGSDKGRLGMWQGTASMIQDAPILGVGPGNWEFLYPLYDSGRMVTFATAPKRPHNDLLWIAAEAGVPALALHLWLMGSAVAALLAFGRSGRPGQALTACVLAALLIATFVHGLFSFPRALPATSFIFWIALGLSASLGGAPRLPGRPRGPRSSVRLASGLLPALLALALGITLRHMSFDSHYRSMRQFEAAGDYGSLWNESKRALDDGPFEPDAFLFRAKAEQAAGLLPEATSTLREGLRYHPNSSQLLGDLGTVLAGRDSLDAAEAAYRKALALVPDHHQVLNNLGGVHQKRGDLAAAIGFYVQARDLLPHQYADAHANLGPAYLAAGRVDESIEASRTGLGYFPEDAVLHHNLADALAEKADGDPRLIGLAVESYRQFLKYWQGPASYAETARTRIALLRRRLEDRPDVDR